MSIEMCIRDSTFGSYIKQMKWLNFGGGHHITRSDYDIETLIRCIQFAQDTYGVQAVSYTHLDVYKRQIYNETKKSPRYIISKVILNKERND